MVEILSRSPELVKGKNTFRDPFRAIFPKLTLPVFFFECKKTNLSQSQPKHGLLGSCCTTRLKLPGSPDLRDGIAMYRLLMSLMLVLLLPGCARSLIHDAMGRQLAQSQKRDEAKRLEKVDPSDEIPRISAEPSEPIAGIEADPDPFAATPAKGKVDSEDLQDMRLVQEPPAQDAHSSILTISTATDVSKPNENETERSDPDTATSLAIRSTDDIAGATVAAPEADQLLASRTEPRQESVNPVLTVPLGLPEPPRIEDVIMASSAPSTAHVLPGHELATFLARLPVPAGNDPVSTRSEYAVDRGVERVALLASNHADIDRALDKGLPNTRCVAKVGDLNIGVAQLSNAVRARITLMSGTERVTRRQVISLARSVLEGMIERALVALEAERRFSSPDQRSTVEAQIQDLWQHRDLPHLCSRENVADAATLDARLAPQGLSTKLLYERYFVRELGLELARKDSEATPMQQGEFTSYLDLLRQRYPIRMLMTSAEIAAAAGDPVVSTGKESQP